jgi:CHAD domain-containing protein
MDVTCDGKWFWVEPPTARVAAAAERILEIRLAEVQKFLPLAARHDADDVEYVHQLRVSCRRAAAALRAFEPLAGRGGKKLKRWLKKLREAAGPARDADVYLARLRSELDPANQYAQELVGVVRQSREEAQAALVKIDKRASRGGFQRAIDNALDRIARSDDELADESFAEFALRAVADATHEVDAIDAPTASIAELHQLRIAAKRLRYAIEIFHSAATPELRLELYPQVEEMQERLGAVNDRSASQARLQQWLGELPPDGLAAFVAGLVVSEHAMAGRLRGEFLQWWTPERQTRVTDGLAAAFA